MMVPFGTSRYTFFSIIIILEKKLNKTKVHSLMLAKRNCQTTKKIFLQKKPNQWNRFRTTKINTAIQKKRVFEKFSE